MKKVLDYIKKNIVKLFVLILILASVIVLFTNCALLENNLYSKELTGWNVFFGLKETSEITIMKQVISSTTTTLNCSVLGIITLCLLFITTVFYFLEDILFKKVNACITLTLYLISAILYLLTFMYPSFAQETMKDDYKLTLMVVVGFSIVMLAFITVLVKKIYPKLKSLIKKKSK